MKKSILLAIVCLGTFFNVIAQAVLPTSWSFSNSNLPTGWTESGTAFYTASGNTPPSAKLDNTGDWIQINYAGAAGDVSYYVAGNSFSGGTFLVQESVDGQTWTIVRSHTTLPNGTYSLFTDVLSPSSRYVRFFYQQKVGGNVGLDDVLITPVSAGPQQEIAITYNGSSLFSGSTIYVSSGVGVQSPITLNIENEGLQDALVLTNATLTGAQASDYALATSLPMNVTATTTSNFVVNFTPSVAGYRDAVLTIANNDADENPFVINIKGIGGTYASEPASQPTALIFPTVKTYRVVGGFTASTDAPEGYLVLRSIGAPVTGIPADGTVYQRGDIIGNAQVISSSSVLTFSPSNVIASTVYHFAVFAYNGPNQFRNYNTTNPLIGSVTTPATMQPANYYNSIDENVPTFLTDLKSLINPHQVQFYSNYGVRMISNYIARDTTDGRKVLTCVYSGENKIYTEPFDFTSNGYSREHTFCHSWMPTNPAQNLPEYQDYHHLYPTNQNQVNGLRSNYPLGEVVDVISTYQGAKYGKDVNGRIVFEPRDEHKGDASRAMFYVVATYNGVDGKTWKLPEYISNSIVYGQDQVVLKKWHLNDPPSKSEIARNDYIDSLQGNRNPFIDNPSYACFINFKTPDYNPNACELSIEEQLDNNFFVYPNPSKDQLFVNIDGVVLEKATIFDLQGKVVLEESLNKNSVAIMNVSKVKAGSYLLTLQTSLGTVTKKVIVE